MLTQGKGEVRKCRSQRRMQKTIELDEVDVETAKVRGLRCLSTSEIGKEFHKTTVIL